MAIIFLCRYTLLQIINYNLINYIFRYAPDAPEIQMRKLGDLYFMFGHYSMAFQVYHAAKRDFNSDQAWFYYAGALEMAGLAAFMANECTRKTYDYVEESIVTYLNVCKLVLQYYVNLYLMLVNEMGISF